MPGNFWQWVLVVVLIALGSLLALRAWRMAVREKESEPRIEVLAAVGGGLVTGIAVGLSALFLEDSLEESQERATWKANVEIAESIPGFSPRDRSVRDINFSGKVLRNADFKGADLRDVQFQDTVLIGARFDGADLRGANLIGANLQEASLRDANLEGAMLHSANLSHAIVNDPGTSFTGALVNARTCWPKKVAAEKLSKVTVQEYSDEKTEVVLSPADDISEDDFRGGQKHPGCTLWRGGERIHW